MAAIEIFYPDAGIPAAAIRDRMARRPWRSAPVMALPPASVGD